MNIVLLTALLLLSCATLSNDYTKYTSGQCVAFDNSKLPKGSYADPNTEVYIIEANLKSDIPSLRYDYYSIEFTNRKTKEEVSTGVSMKRFNYITYRVICGSCCPPGKTCKEGCKRSEN